MWAGGGGSAGAGEGPKHPPPPRAGVLKQWPDWRWRGFVPLAAGLFFGGGTQLQSPTPGDRGGQGWPNRETATHTPGSGQGHGAESPKCIAKGVSHERPPPPLFLYAGGAVAGNGGGPGQALQAPAQGGGIPSWSIMRWIAKPQPSTRKTERLLMPVQGCIGTAVHRRRRGGYPQRCITPSPPPPPGGTL